MGLPLAIGGAAATGLWNSRDKIGKSLNDGFNSVTGKNVPPPPDYQAAAQQQSQGSQVNMSGPNSTQTWTTGPDGRPVLQSQLAGGLGDANAALQGQAAANVGNMPDGMAARQQAFDAAMNQAQSRLDPMFAQREESLRSQLINQGLDPNSEAFKNASGDFERSRNDAYQGALNNATMQSTEAGNAIFNQGMQSQQLPYQQMAMLQALQGPQFGASAGGYQGPQTLAATMAQDNSAMSRWQQEQQRWADLIGGGGDMVRGNIDGLLNILKMGGGFGG